MTLGRTNSVEIARNPNKAARNPDKIARNSDTTPVDVSKLSLSGPLVNQMINY